MNKLFTIALSILMIISCSSARYVALDGPQEEIIAATVLAAKHPELVEHYHEGVLRITSLREIPLGNGEYDYDIRYQFVKYHYPTLEERLELLSTRYPELYKLYIDGRIELLEVYKYVDDNLNIRTFVSYRRIYDSYYYSYPRYYYRGQRYHSRPLPPTA